MKTSELVGPALDWAVAKCEGHDTRNNRVVMFSPDEAESDDPLRFICAADNFAHAIEQCEDAYPGCVVESVEDAEVYSPSTDWAQGGPIIEREGITVAASERPGHWCAYRIDALFDGELDHEFQKAAAPLIAAMRCYVASKLGDEIELPESFA